MKYCQQCLQPDTRPNTIFGAGGLCPACIYDQSLKDVDWLARYEILKELLSKEKKNKSGFDCIVGVSGGKDSTRQALWVRDNLGLKPLLVCLSFPPQQVAERGVDNISNLINLGFDVVFSSPAPETWRKLMRESFFKFTNWARSTELALFSAVPQIAIKYNIPLIFWGENPALQVGDLKTQGRNGYDGNSLRYSNTLATGHAWMIENGFPPNGVLPFVYPSVEQFAAANIQIIFLGWFLGDWSLINNGAYASANGLHIRNEELSSTGDLYGNSNLDEDWHLMNQMIKYYKFGFGKVTECVNEELRGGTMSRAEAINIVEEFDGACSNEYIESFCTYLDISIEQFWVQVHSSVNRDLFTIELDGTIRRKFKVGIGI